MGVSSTKAEHGAVTRQRLLEAAEELFSKEGFDRVSVRDITDRARANVAAVNYHFGSREGLVEQVMVRYIDPINEERLLRLDQLEKKSGKRAVPLEELLDAFVRPFVSQVRKSELSERLFYKLMGRLCGDQAAKMPVGVEAGFMKMFTRFQRAFAKALPELSEDDLVWRVHFMVGAMIHTMAHAETLHRFTHGASGTPSMEETLSRFIRFSVAGMREGIGRNEKSAKGPQSEFEF